MRMSRPLKSMRTLRPPTSPDDELYYQEEPWAEDPDPQLEEAYATYLDARRQFANLKAAHGYYPVVALTSTADLQGASSSSATTQRPLSKGGKGKKGKSKGKSPPQKGPALQRGRTALDLMQCFKDMLLQTVL